MRSWTWGLLFLLSVAHMPVALPLCRTNALRLIQRGHDPGRMKPRTASRSCWLPWTAPRTGPGSRPCASSSAMPGAARAPHLAHMFSFCLFLFTSMLYIFYIFTSRLPSAQPGVGDLGLSSQLLPFGLVSVTVRFLCFPALT